MIILTIILGILFVLTVLYGSEQNKSIIQKDELISDYLFCIDIHSKYYASEEVLAVMIYQDELSGERESILRKMGFYITEFHDVKHPLNEPLLKIYPVKNIINKFDKL